MKTLGALPSFFLTSIRKDFVRQITDVYYTETTIPRYLNLRRISEILDILSYVRIAMRIF